MEGTTNFSNSLFFKANGGVGGWLIYQEETDWNYYNGLENC
jgi:hypothetical protein